MYRRTTRAFVETIAKDGPAALSLPGVVASPGGMPIFQDGKVIGMNTAIFSPSGGSVGIGFAIPVSTARQVMESLIQVGRIRLKFQWVLKCALG